MNDLIAQARKRYLAAHPIGTIELPTVDAKTGAPGTPFILPDVGDVQIVGCKLGMEYLAICHDEDATEEWIQTAMSIARTPETAGILFANVFRGMNLVIGGMTDRPGVREHLARQAVDAWNRDFAADFGGGAA